jgi:hypothetical protein
MSRYPKWTPEMAKKYPVATRIMYFITSIAFILMIVTLLGDIVMKYVNNQTSSLPPLNNQKKLR